MCSAAATFYAAIALVPALVLLLTFASWAIGDDRVVDWGRHTAAALPDGLGADDVFREFVENAVALPLPAALAGLLPATLYGEGLRRTFGHVAPGGRERRRWVGWRGRLAFLPLLVLALPALVVVLACGPLLASLFPRGAGGTVAGVLVAFAVNWVLLSPLLAVSYRILGPVTPRWKSCFVGGFTVGSFLAGFLEGFVVFIAIPLDLGVPFGGYEQVGAAAAVALWTYLLHMIALAGYRFALELDTTWPGSGAGRDGRAGHHAPGPLA